MERIDRLHLQELLANLNLGSSIADGCVNIISVEAIRERSGVRWDRKRDQVEAFVLRAFRRQGQTSDMILAIGETDFVTVQPDASRAAALNVSANILQETLTFFLGAAAREDLRLSVVTGLAEGEIQAEQVDAERYMAASGLSTASMAPLAARIPAGGMRTASLVSASGLKIEAMFQLEPTWHVARQVVTSYATKVSAFAPSEDRPFDAVPTADLTASVAGDLALAALDYALDALRTSSTARFAVHVPISLRALAASRSRHQLIRRLAEVEQEFRALIMLELIDLEAGLPPSRLTELVAILRPHCRAVFARSPSEFADVRRWRDCRLAGVTLDCEGLEVDERKSIPQLGAFVRAASEVAPAVIGYNLRSRSLMLAAWAAGFTHVAGAIVSEAAPPPATAVRLSARDFYLSPSEAPLMALR